MNDKKRKESAMLNDAVANTNGKRPRDRRLNDAPSYPVTSTSSSRSSLPTPIPYTTDFGPHVQRLLQFVSRGYDITAMGVYDMRAQAQHTGPQKIDNPMPIYDGSLVNYANFIAKQFPVVAESADRRAVARKPNKDAIPCTMFDFGDMGKAVRTALFDEEMSPEAYQLLKHHFHSTPLTVTDASGFVTPSPVLDRDRALFMHALLYGVTHLQIHQPHRKRLMQLLNLLYDKPVFDENCVCQWFINWSNKVARFRTSGERLPNMHGGMHINRLLTFSAVFYGRHRTFVPHPDVNFGTIFAYYSDPQVRVQMEQWAMFPPEVSYTEKAIMHALIQDST